MSHQRARRRLMQWERYHRRWPQSGKWSIGPERYHDAHALAYDRASRQGRYAPNGIRDPWTLYPPYGGA